MSCQLRDDRSGADPHAGQVVESAGPQPENSDGTLVMVHGRGGTAAGILSLYSRFELHTLAAIAPQAGGSTWYPQSFIAPLDANQPFLDSALRRLESIVADLLAQRIPSRCIAILGFSQGACLATEYLARHPRRYGAVIALTGGLIGPPGTPRDYTGSLDGTPIFLGTSDPDPHVPFKRVQETEDVLIRMGGRVELRRYAGMPHTINQDEIDAARDLLQRMVSHSRQDHQ